MSSPAFFLALEASGWQIARVLDQEVELRKVDLPPPPEPNSPAPDILSAVASALKEWGYRGQGVCLGIPSDLVHSARIDCEGLPRRNLHSNVLSALRPSKGYALMLYRLEEQLPLNAEDLSADFLPPVAGTCLGVAVRTDAVEPVLDGLSQAGIEVVAVCPTALLAARDLVSRRAEQMDFIILGSSPSRLDVLRLAEGAPVSWHTVPDSEVESMRALDVELLDRPQEGGPLTVSLLGKFTWDVKTALTSQHADLTLVEDEVAPLAAAARTAAKAVSDESEGWINLRRGGLALPNPWRRCAGLLKSAAAVGLVLLAVLPGLLYWRAICYDRFAQRCLEKQALEYRRLHPGRDLPADVPKALAGELTRLAGTSGTGFELPDRPSALETLRHISANLPPATRLQIVEMRIAANGIVIEGQAREHADAETIAKSLSRGGLTIDPPRTERLPGKGVSFTLAGTCTSQKPPTGGKSP